MGVIGETMVVTLPSEAVTVTAAADEEASTGIVVLPVVVAKAPRQRRSGPTMTRRSHLDLSKSLAEHSL